MTAEKPKIGITLGDPAGVGPEVVAKALAAAPAAARCVVVGSPACLLAAARASNVALAARTVGSPGEALFEPGTIDVVEVPLDARAIRPGVVSAEAGRYAAASLRLAGRLCAEGAFDALVTAPVHKGALHEAGLRVEGQTELLGEMWGGGRYGMLVVAGPLRVLLLTRHLALRAALDRVSTAGALEHLQLLADTLERLGVDAPRIAIAAFNPHAGEGGLFGDEDDRLLAPAVAAARSLGLHAEGPLPADSLFGRAARGEFDGVVALFHDQGLAPAKALAFDSAVTVLAGAPHLRVSVIHGAGFDRAGQNRANPNNLLEALRRASEWAPRWRTAARPASEGTR